MSSTTKPTAPFGSTTPWGRPDAFFEIADGIWEAHCGEDFGYWVSPERYARMPRLTQQCAIRQTTWFNGPTAFAAIPLAFPEVRGTHFPECEAELLRSLPDAFGLFNTLEVCDSDAGFHIGRWNENEGPISRDSVEFWQDEQEALDALYSGTWTLRTS